MSKQTAKKGTVDPKDLSIEGHDLEGKIVVVKEGLFTGMNNFSERVVKCTGGFGCRPECIGKAVYAKWVYNGEYAGKLTRQDIERFATGAEVMEASAFKPRKHPIPEPEMNFLLTKAETMTHETLKELEGRMTQDKKFRTSVRIYQLHEYMSFIINLLIKRGHTDHIKNGLTRMAFTAITNNEATGKDDQWAIGIAEEGSRGYWPYGVLQGAASYEMAMDVARQMNEDILGLDERAAMEIIASTMKEDI